MLAASQISLGSLLLVNHPVYFTTSTLKSYLPFSLICKVTSVEYSIFLTHAIFTKSFEPCVFFDDAPSYAPPHDPSFRATFPFTYFPSISANIRVFFPSFLIQILLPFFAVFVISTLFHICSLVRLYQFKHFSK
jgi:hypothetical protein